MIGQKTLLSIIDSLHNVPHSIILQGGIGSGRKEVAKYIANKINAKIVYLGNDVNSVRTISNYGVRQKDLIVFENADLMLAGSMNALLKITEEPKENLYIVLTISNLELLLPPLVSRCVKFEMNPYTIDDMNSFLDMQNIPKESNLRDILLTACNNFGQIKDLCKYDIEDYSNFAQKIVDKIALICGGNALKLATLFSMKEDDGKYNIHYVLRLVVKLFYNKFIETKDMSYIECSNATLDALRQLNLITTQKQLVLDLWVLSLRKILCQK